MWVQAATFAIALDLLALTRLPWLVPALCACTAAFWLSLNHKYARDLHGKARKDERARDDRKVTGQVAVVVLLPSVFGGIAAGYTPPLDSAPLTVGFTAVACFWLATYWSCLVDWYYIRPRRDGVVGHPPCHGGSEDWTTVTRLWYLHRGIVVVVGAVAGVVALSAFALAALPREASEDPVKVGSLIVAAAGGGLALSRLIYGSLATIGDVFTSCCFSAPDIAIGEKLTGDGVVLEGYVRDVAIEGVTVVVLSISGGPEMGPDGKARTKRYGLSSVLDKPDIAGEPFAPCSRTCREINDQCQWLDPADTTTSRQASPKFLVL